MKLHGNDYSKRLESFSMFTMVLISGIDKTKEMAHKATDIISDSDLSEEQVQDLLLQLIHSNDSPLTLISHNDAMEIVCDALEHGYIYSLFEILNDTATLRMVDDNNQISGVRNIIEFFAKERLNHLYPSDKETITCDILRVAKGERYGVGEKCILLTYHLQNGERQNYIIKVHCENNMICQLEIFYPYGPLHLVADE